jgi:hypothetical protein
MRPVASRALLHDTLFFGLLFNPEDGGDMLLANFDWLSTGYNPKRQFYKN